MSIQTILALTDPITHDLQYVRVKRISVKQVDARGRSVEPYPLVTIEYASASAFIGLVPVPLVSEWDKAWDIIMEKDEYGMLALDEGGVRKLVQSLVSSLGEAVHVATTTLEEEAEQEALAGQAIAEQEAEAQAKAEWRHDQDEKSRHMEDEGPHEEAV